MAIDDNDDVELGDPNEMYDKDRISQARWDRARNDIDVRDVLDMLFGLRGSPIRCPFHGSDTTPSFVIMMKNNDCHCYGCPEGDSTWNNVKLVARANDISKPQALRWLEREFHLPPMSDDEIQEGLDMEEGTEEQEEEEPPLLLDIQDIRVPFIGVANRIIREETSIEDKFLTARDLLLTRFASEFYNDPKPLARIIGSAEINHLIQVKATGHHKVVILKEQPR